MSPRRRRALSLSLVLLASIVTDARADEWLTPRHDAQRTGASSGTTNISRPAVAWRRYLGGQLSTSQYFALDVDRDGADEIAFISGGRAVAKHANNVIVWESPLLGLTTLGGVVDFDMDGSVEIVAYSNSRVYVLSSVDGHVLWANPAGPIAEVGGVRVGDLDGDARPDLYIGECRCCTLRGSAPGVAYGFTGGFDHATQLWTLASGIGGCGADQDQIADVTGDAHREIVVPSRDDALQIVNGADGTLLSAIPAPPGGSLFATRVIPVDIDADPTLEFVAVTNNYLATGDRGARRVVVYDSTPAGFVALWQANALDRVNGSLDTVDGAIGDLDGHPGIEVAISIWDAGVPRLEVRNAVTGAVLATQSGANLLGAADLDNDGANELLVTEANALTAYHFDGSALVRRWSITGRGVLRGIDHGRYLRDPNAIRLLTANLDADPTPELVLLGYDASGREGVWAVDAEVDPPHEIGHFIVPAGITILDAAVGHNLTNPYDQLAVTTSDGYLIVLDRTLAPTNRITQGEIQLPGMRVGGYYSGPYGIGPTPSIAQLGTPAIMVRDSRPALLRLDASAANATTEPTTVWTRSGAQWPLVFDADGDGARDVVVTEGHDLIALDAATATHERWRATDAIPPEGLIGDVLPMRRNASVTDLVFPARFSGAVFTAVSVDGMSGSIRWSGFTRALQWGYQSYAVGDLTGDGADDMVSVTNSTIVLDGASGTLQNDNNTFVAYAMPMLTDADGDGVTDVWVHGGYFPDRLLARDMTDRVQRTDVTTPNTGRYGARVTCGTDAVVVEGSYESPDVWAVRLRDATPIAHRSLANGDVFDGGMIPSDHHPGSLGNVTSIADLGGGHAAVLVGSTDGYLYALDPCTLDRIWSIDLGYPVGEPVVGDIDGRAGDEVLVTCADGFLYAIGNAAYDAPMTVLDVDPMGADPTADVDEIDTVDTLYARWTSVPGATAYEVGVFSEAGSETRFPNTVNVGNVTNATIDMLPLRQGARYYVSVRPIGPDGPGIAARSDGVAVTDNLPPDASVSVTPTRAWPASGITPTVQANCSDRVGLSHYAVEIHRRDGALVRVLDDADYTGASRTVSIAWDGRDTAGSAQPAGDYTARVICRDLRMREANADGSFVLDPAATATDGGTGDGGMSMSGGAGCGCRVTATSRRERVGAWRGAWVLAFAVASAMRARRRMRRAN